MAYRPTNNTRENVIHQNTIFESQGMVACCTCGYCIEKREDSTLTLTNFKAANPLINEDSIGSTIIEFSDYMIPNGSFEYSLIPFGYGSPSYQDESIINDNKFATSLAYFPFLRCDGIQTTSPIVTSNELSLNPVQNNIQYGSSFAYINYNPYFNHYNYIYGNGYIALNPTLTDNASSMFFVNMNGGKYGFSEGIYYDQNQFGSFLYSTFAPSYNYSNTDLRLSYVNSMICNDFGRPVDSLNYSSCPTQSDYYKWGVNPSSAYIYNLTSRYLSREALDGAITYGYYLSGYNTNFIDKLFPRITNLEFSSELSYNLLNVLEFGPTPSFVYQFNIFPPFSYYYGYYWYESQYLLALSDFQTGGNGGTPWVLNPDTGLNESRTIYYEPNPSDTSNPPIPPCSNQQIIDNASQFIPIGNADIQSFLTPKSIPLPKVDIGSAQAYFNYIGSHDFSQRGFKTDASCANGIVKVMQPVFFADFDNYNFSFVHPDYEMTKKQFYITDKFLVPDRTSWSDCHTTSSRTTENAPWVDHYPDPVPAKTVKFKEMNSLAGVYKEGYVLDRFNFNMNGSFLATLSIIEESPFYSVGLESSYYTQKNPYYIYTGTIGSLTTCAINMVQIIDTVSRFYYYWYNNNNNNIVNNYSSPLLFKGNFISDAVPISFFEYVDQETIYNYTNGYFSSHNNSIYPFVYYEDACQGFMNRSSFSGLAQYVAQKTERTRTTSRTDSSGWTTVLIENVLWVGKSLLTETYVNPDSPLAINGGVTKIIPSRQQTFSSVPFVAIAGPTGTNRIQATAVPIMDGQILTGIQITNFGSGYIEVPNVQISPNPGISFYVEIEDNRKVLANGQRIPATYNAFLKGGFESDIEVGFQSVAICKSQNIADRMKRVSKVKVNFENYEKIPQVNTVVYDYQNAFIQATPETPDGYFNNTFYPYNYFVYDYFSNIAYGPPNINQNEPIFLNIQNGSYSIIKDVVPIDPLVLTSYVAKAGRAYPDFGVADRFKSCLLINGDKDVWKTGNEIKFVGLDYLVTNGGSGYTSVPTVTLSNGGGTGASAKATISNGRVVAVTVVNKGINYTSNKTVVISGGGGTGATAVDISFTPFYSIYMEEIKDEKQTAGQTLIRIARTLQDANNGIYIPNVGLETLYKDKSLSVKFLYGWKDVSKENAPRYEEGFDPNGLDFSNFNANKFGASAIEVGEFLLNTDGLINIYPATYLALFPVPYIYWQGGVTYSGNDRFEIISLSPLKIKFVGSKFYSSSKSYTISGFVTPDNTSIPDFSVGRSYGFMCDMIIEEVVDEFIQEALPVEFNQILENVEYIQTSNLMNSRKPMQMINPEQCEHIGKVIDRKDCNCPKKWVRLCDVHGKTDWKKCMQCQDFKMSE